MAQGPVSTPADLRHRSANLAPAEIVAAFRAEFPDYRPELGDFDLYQDLRQRFPRSIGALADPLLEGAEALLPLEPPPAPLLGPLRDVPEVRKEALPQPKVREQTWGEVAKGAAQRIGPAIGGAVIGGAVGGPVGAIGMGIYGGLTGEMVARGSERAAGTRPPLDISPSGLAKEAAGVGTAGLLSAPVGLPLRAGASVAARLAVRGAEGAGLGLVQQEIDRRLEGLPAPSLGQRATVGGIGALLGSAGGAVEARVAMGQTLAEAEKRLRQRVLTREGLKGTLERIATQAEASGLDRATARQYAARATRALVQGRPVPDPPTGGAAGVLRRREGDLLLAPPSDRDAGVRFATKAEAGAAQPASAGVPPPDTISPVSVRESVGESAPAVTGAPSQAPALRWLQSALDAERRAAPTGAKAARAEVEGIRADLLRTGAVRGTPSAQRFVQAIERFLTTGESSPEVEAAQILAQRWMGQLDPATGKWKGTARPTAAGDLSRLTLWGDEGPLFVLPQRTPGREVPGLFETPQAPRPLEALEPPPGVAAEVPAPVVPPAPTAPKPSVWEPPLAARPAPEAAPAALGETAIRARAEGRDVVAEVERARESAQRLEAMQPPPADLDLNPPPGDLVNYARSVGMKVDADETIRILGSSLYAGGRDRAVLTELLQNAIDEAELTHGTSGAGEITVRSGTAPRYTDKLTSSGFSEGEQAFLRDRLRPDDLSRETKVIQVSDNGRGMTPEFIEQTFLTVGASGKRDVEGAAGGFGFAKAAFLAAPDYVHVSSVADTPAGRVETILEGSLGAGYQIDTRPSTAPTGTTVRTWLVPREGEYLQVPRLGERITGEVGQSFKAPGTRLQHIATSPDVEPFFGEYKPGEYGHVEARTYAPADYDVVAEATTPGATIHVYRAKSGETELAKSASYQVLNQGMRTPVTASIGSYHGPELRLPKDIRVDVRSTVPEGDPNYPFTANRESLRGTASTAIEEVLNTHIYKPILHSYRGAYRELFNTLEEIPLPTGSPRKAVVYDTGGRLTPAETQELTSLPVVRDLMSAFDHIAGWYHQLKDDILLPGDRNLTVSRLGLLFDAGAAGRGQSETFGVNIKVPTDVAQNEAMVLVNLGRVLDGIRGPSADVAVRGDELAELSALLHHTFIHELNHSVSGNEGAGFTFNLLRLYGYLTSDVLQEQHHAIARALSGRFDELDRVLQLSREAGQRTGTRPNFLTGELARKPAPGEGGAAIPPAARPGAEGRPAEPSPRAAAELTPPPGTSPRVPRPLPPPESAARPPATGRRIFFDEARRMWMDEEGSLYLPGRAKGALDFPVPPGDAPALRQWMAARRTALGSLPWYRRAERTLAAGDATRAWQIVQAARVGMLSRAERTKLLGFARARGERGSVRVQYGGERHRLEIPQPPAVKKVQQGQLRQSPSALLEGVGGMPEAAQLPTISHDVVAQILRRTDRAKIAAIAGNTDPAYRVTRQVVHQILSENPKYRAVSAALGMSPDELARGLQATVTESARILNRISQFRREAPPIFVEQFDRAVGPETVGKIAGIASEGDAAVKLYGSLFALDPADAVKLLQQATEAFDQAHLQWMLAKEPKRLGAFHRFVNFTNATLTGTVEQFWRNGLMGALRWDLGVVEDLAGASFALAYRPSEARVLFRRAVDRVTALAHLPGTAARPWGDSVLTMWPKVARGLDGLSPRDVRHTLRWLAQSPEAEATFLGRSATDLPVNDFASQTIKVIQFWNRLQEYPLRALATDLSMRAEIRRRGFDPSQVIADDVPLATIFGSEEAAARALMKAVKDGTDVTYAGNAIRGTWNAKLIDLFKSGGFLTLLNRFSRFGLSAGPRYLWDRSPGALVEVLLARKMKGRLVHGLSVRRILDEALPAREQRLREISEREGQALQKRLALVADRRTMVRRLRSLEGMAEKVAAGQRAKFTPVEIQSRLVDLRNRLRSTTNAISAYDGSLAAINHEKQIVAGQVKGLDAAFQRSSDAAAPESLAELLGRAALGSMMIGAAAWVAAQSSQQDLPWYQIRVGESGDPDETITDIRAYGGMAQWFYLGKVLHEFYAHGDRTAYVAARAAGKSVPEAVSAAYTGKYDFGRFLAEGAQALLSMNPAAGAQATLLDFLDPQRLTPGGIADGVLEFVGEIGAAAFQPLQSYRNLASAAFPEEGVVRSPRASEEAPLGELGAPLAKIPGLSQIIPETISQTSGEPLRSARAWTRPAFGVTFVTPPNAVERELRAAGVDPRATYVPNLRQTGLNQELARIHSRSLRAIFDRRVFGDRRWEALTTPEQRRDYLERFILPAAKQMTKRDLLRMFGRRTVTSARETPAQRERRERTRALVEAWAARDDMGLSEAQRLDEQRRELTEPLEAPPPALTPFQRLDQQGGLTVPPQ